MSGSRGRRRDARIAAIPPLPESAVPSPLYRRVMAHIEGLIRDGHWPTGRRIPSENALVEALGVSRMTANRALRELAQRGLLQRLQGVGTFVAERKRHASLVEIRNIAEEIRAEGGVHSARILRRELAAAGAELAMRMGLAARDAVHHLLLVHCRDGAPIQLEARAINPALAADFAAVDLARTTPAEYLIGQVPADEIEHTVRAVMPDARTRELLELPPGEPCLQLDRRTWAGDAVVSCATFSYPGSRYDLYARYRTQGRQPYTALPGGFAPRR